ncbi:hypothetical protein LPJ66_005566 [Kickxella alabastrina]|uniref:Uncharacterized protein n=1 Tax=Kickxella alabastrina TaxID=61397 RepID=A0ACC1IIH6_9FUNG|nr:hypothetical protein LPJ66_005566 [Kickxella alabastrina]
MTSYSFGDASATLVDSALESTSAGGGNGSGNTGGNVYDGTRVYRQDSVMGNSHHTGDYQLHHTSHAIDTKGMHSGDNIGASSASLAGVLAGINAGSVNDGSFADYFFKQQVMSLNSSHNDSSSHGSPQQQHQQHQIDVSSVVAAVAAAASAVDNTGFSVYQHSSTAPPSAQPSSLSLSGHTQRQYSYSTQNYQDAESSHQSPSVTAAVLSGNISMSPVAATNILSSANTSSLTLETNGTSATLLVSSIPSFLSSLPLQNSTESSKYSSMVARLGTNNSRNESGGIYNDDNTGNNNGRSVANNVTNNSILEAAAAAAAAAVVNTGGGTGSGFKNALSSAASNSELTSLSASSNSYYSHQNSHSHYNQPHSHSYGQQQDQSAYSTNSLSFSHDPMSTVARTAQADIPNQSTAGSLAANGTAAASSVTGMVNSAANIDLNYSVSSFSRPLSQLDGATTVFMSNSSSIDVGRASNGTGTGLNSSFAGVGHTSSVMSPPQQLHGQYSYYQQQQQQQPTQRNYNDYSAYYRSPSTALGMAAATGNASTGVSPMSGTGMGGGATVGASTHTNAASSIGSSQISGAAAAAAAAAVMGSGYYASAYQPYMRTGASNMGGSGSSVSGTHSYYYSQAPTRYIPYGAYPPIRHFVSPARPFKCETCEQSFSRNHDLKRHVKIHSGVKPHKCHKCGKSFGRSDALKRHSMVKRCRSTNGNSAAKSTPTPASGSGSMGMSAGMAMSMSSQRQHQQHHQQHQEQQSSGGVMTSISNGSRLAPVGTIFGQSSAQSINSSNSSIVSSMLSSRANVI